MGAAVALILVAGALIRFLVHQPVPSPDSSEGTVVAEPAVPLPEPVAVVSEPNNAPAPETAPGPTAPAPLATENPPPAAPAVEPLSYDARIAAMVDIVQANRAMGPEAKQRISALLESPEPQNQASGLVLLAGLGMLEASYDVSKHSPEVVLAAVDLCESLFSDSAARALLGQWMERMGGAQTASEMAHRLLVEARLPLGGGSAALERMIGVNDPPSILVGLYEFAVNPDLPAATRTEALYLLRDHMESEAYANIVQDCTRQVREAGDAWIDRAERMLAWMARPSAPDRSFIESAFAQPNAGTLADLELFLRHEFQAGRLTLDSDTAAALRQSLARLDESSLAGPDRSAVQSLQRHLDVWTQNRP